MQTPPLEVFLHHAQAVKPNQSCDVILGQQFRAINWRYARLICNAESNSTKTGKHGSRQLVPLNTQTPGREDIKTTLHMLWSWWKLSFGACLMFISLIISGLWSTNPTFSLYVELWAIQSAINSWKRLSFTSTWRLIQWNRHEPRSATNRFEKHEVYWFWGWRYS